jgi:hypothetical protein
VITRALVVLVVLLTACTRPKPQHPMPPRLPESPPEQKAALDRAADLGLPADERRWQIESAKELKRIEAYREEQKSNKILIPMPAPNDSGVFGDGGAADGGAR